MMGQTALGCLFKHKCASVIEHTTKYFIELLFELKQNYFLVTGAYF